MAARRAGNPNQPRAGNLAGLIQRRRRLLRLAGAFGAGVVLAAAFAPLDWYWVAWVGLIPVLALGLTRPRGAWLVGYVFGIGHFWASFWWLGEVATSGTEAAKLGPWEYAGLRTVGALAPLGVAVVCGLFPALWLHCGALWYRLLLYPPARELEPHADPALPGAQAVLGPARRCLLVVLLAISWCAWEWCRSWFLTGMPWNLLGVSQWHHQVFLELARYTGVYGVSLIVVAVNAGLYLAAGAGPSPIATPARAFRARLKALNPWPLTTAAVVVIIALLPVWVGHRNYPQPETKQVLRVAACQGDIPQIRFYRPGQLEAALEAYLKLSEDAVAAYHPDLLVWPESALPESLTRVWTQCNEFYADRDAASNPFHVITVPLLAGSIEERPAPDGGEPRVYNCALLLSPQCEVRESYGKMHRVPFGEYVPFARYLPWLVAWIGMGRNLTAGTEFTVFDLGQGAHAGINICYEDVFPEISRGFVRRGANVLMTITNDAWYNRSAAGRQHLAHAIWRAAENFRPLLRSGNNSDTCLIWPDGRVTGLLVDATTGNRFCRRHGLFTVPVWDHLPLTFYTVHGEWFAHLCAAVTALVLAWSVARWLRRKRALHELITGTAKPGR